MLRVHLIYPDAFIAGIADGFIKLGPVDVFKPGPCVTFMDKIVV